MKKLDLGGKLSGGLYGMGDRIFSPDSSLIGPLFSCNIFTVFVVAYFSLHHYMHTDLFFFFPGILEKFTLNVRHSLYETDNFLLFSVFFFFFLFIYFY